jgi:quinol-cytochrome oxidoreductase complex cytochrome b subunit
MLLVLVPFLDKRTRTTGRSPTFTAIGIVCLLYMVGMTAWGYRSLTPVYAILLTAVVMAVLSIGTRRAPRVGPER